MKMLNPVSGSFHQKAGNGRAGEMAVDAKTAILPSMGIRDSLFWSQIEMILAQETDLG